MFNRIIIWFRKFFKEREHTSIFSSVDGLEEGLIELYKNEKKYSNLELAKKYLLLMDKIPNGTFIFHNFMDIVFQRRNMSEHYYNINNDNIWIEARDEINYEAIKKVRLDKINKILENINV